MKKKIALVTGGYSGEAAISYKSAVTINDNLDKEIFDVYIIDINQQGWFYVDENGGKTEVNKDNFSIQANGETINFDAVFIGMHGTPGEDGKLQGYFDMMKLPYTSCDSATSALTFNKRYTTAVAAMAGIPVAKSVHLFHHTGYDLNGITSQLKLPVFVKPNNGGSSIGMSKVTEAEHLEAALEKAFQEDNQVLVEEMIQGREFTVGVFKSEGEIIVLPITEVIPQKDFFDYEAKYHGASSEITPAEMPEHWRSKVEEAAQRIYQVFNCNGVVRIDFIYNEQQNQPFMLEINTVPGQSEASIIPQQVRAKGWTLKMFYTWIVMDALEKYKVFAS